MKTYEEYQNGLDCINFSGYKPCMPYKMCFECKEKVRFNKIILVVALQGLGSVLMVSAILKPLRDKYTDSKIIFLTSDSAVPLLKENPYINEVISWNNDQLFYISQLEYDLVINFDRSKPVAAFINMLKSKEKMGFYLHKSGSILYSGESFEYLYHLGLDDNLRLRGNQKSMANIMVESIGLTYEHDPYKVYLSETQKLINVDLMKQYKINSKNTIGFNTGCSGLMKNRKFSVESIKNIIKKLLVNKNIQVLLLGGIDEKELNNELSQIDERIIDLTNDKGMDFGIASADLCKVILSGCSFGLHLGIALSKRCVAWFGPSCEQEVELFAGGKKFKSKIECSPCWQKDCNNKVKCNELIPVDDIVDALLLYFS